MIFTCIISRAVYVDVYAFRRYVSIRGWLSSDKGSQLVGSSKELKSIVKGLGWNGIQDNSSKHWTEWCFSPADAPWYNGTAEALIKSVKRALST